MNTKTLVVGQIVRMVSGGVYERSGKVVKITADGVDVDMRNEQQLEIWKFDTNGKACDSRSTGYVPEPYESDGVPSTYEGGHWVLYDISEWEHIVNERVRKYEEHKKKPVATLFRGWRPS